VVYLRGAPRATVAPGAPEIISQQDTAFVPALLTVSPGVTVDFANEDPFFHNVFSYSQAKRFDLGRFPAGESKSVTFEETGIVKVYCEVHDFMRAVVLVLDTPYHSLVSEATAGKVNGTLSLEPIGAHKLKGFSKDCHVFRVNLSTPG